MNVWAWFAVPPMTLLAAYYALGPVEKAAPPPPAPPAIEALRLPPSLAVATGGTGYQRGGAPKEIRLAAFGVIVPEAVTGPNLAAVVPPAKELFALQAVLLAGEKNRTATIDGKIYKEGDKFHRRYRLSRVEADAVWLNGPRGREVLRFPEFRDAPAPLAVALPSVAMQPPGKPVAAGALGGLPGGLPSGKIDSEYRKILEMLKL